MIFDRAAHPLAPAERIALHHVRSAAIPRRPPRRARRAGSGAPYRPLAPDRACAEHLLPSAPRRGRGSARSALSGCCRAASRGANTRPVVSGAWRDTIQLLADELGSLHRQAVSGSRRKRRARAATPWPRPCPVPCRSRVPLPRAAPPPLRYAVTMRKSALRRGRGAARSAPSGAAARTRDSTPFGPPWRKPGKGGEATRNRRGAPETRRTAPSSSSGAKVQVE